MSGLPVIIVDSGGWPVTISESDPGGMSMTISDSGYGFPVTVVESGGFPVSGIATGVGALANVTCISAADDDEPDFEFDLPPSATAGMVIAAEYSVANADSWSSYFDHTLTAPEITADVFTVFGVTTLAQGLWDFRFRLEDGAEFGAWTTIEDVPINFAPTITTLLPADGATGVAVDANLVITFNKNIQFGTGNINIYKSDDTLFETFDVETDAGTKVTIAGAVLTINPTGTLANSTGYYVQIDAIAIQNTDGVSFAGIADETTYNFTTVASATAFELKIDTFYSDGTWTAPADIRANIAKKVELWAAGGAAVTNLGSGGGGAYSRGEDVAVTPSSGYAVVVGVGAAAANGTNSTFNSTTVVAEGGKAQGNGNSGGLAANGTGTVKWSGGNGQAATGTTFAGTGAGSGGNGVNTGNFGGAPDGGTGLSAASATPGNAWGAGGRSSASAAGVGGKGHCRITYEVPRTASYAYCVGRIGGRNPGAASTSNTVTYPTIEGGILAGDLLMLVLAAPNATVTWTTTGYAQIDTDASTNFKSDIMTKVAAGGETGTFTLTSSASVLTTWILLVYRSAGTPATLSANSTTGAPNPPSLSPAGGSAPYLWLSISATNGGGLNTAPATAASSGFNNIFIQGGQYTGGSMLQVCELRETTATKDPGTHTPFSAVQPWAAFTIAIPFS